MKLAWKGKLLGYSLCFKLSWVRVQTLFSDHSGSLSAVTKASMSGQVLLSVLGKTPASLLLHLSLSLILGGSIVYAHTAQSA